MAKMKVIVSIDKRDFKVEFNQGIWTRAMVDKVHIAMLRELPNHIREIRKLEELRGATNE